MDKNINEEKIELKTKNNKTLYLVIGIVILLLIILSGTYAYFAFNATNEVITGDAASVNLGLTVTKVLPTTTGTDNILVSNIQELAGNLNKGCLDDDDEFTLCQVYKVHLANNSTGVNTNVAGSISFNNTNTPNLSWMLINNYSASTTYTSTTLGNNYNTSSQNFTNFVNNYLVEAGSSADFYILMWINETDGAQTDEGSYSGTIKFQDANGKGVTSTFTS